MRSRLFLIGLVLVATLLYFWVGSATEHREKMSTVTIFGKGGGGVGLFYELLQRRSVMTTVLQRPFLTKETFAGAHTVLLLSPSMRLSAREENQLLDFVSDGGTLFVSVHNRDSFLQLVPLLRKLGLPTVVEDTPDFKNGAAQSSTNKEKIGPFNEKESYEFYSPIRFGPCLESCFARTLKMGKGQVTLALGLPVFSNALIAKADNKNVAFRLASSPHILVDEYHHFFSDRTFSDLLARPPFFLTMTGILTLLLLFFFFSYSSLSYPRNKSSRVERTGMGFHHLGESLLTSVIEKGDSDREALARHQSFLKKSALGAPPEFEARLKEIVPEITQVLPKNSFISKARRLVKLHQEWLDRKAGLRL